MGCSHARVIFSSQPVTSFKPLVDRDRKKRFDFDCDCDRKKRFDFDCDRDRKKRFDFDCDRDRKKRFDFDCDFDRKKDRRKKRCGCD